jgi:hypothetical protein
MLELSAVLSKADSLQGLPAFSFLGSNYGFARKSPGPPVPE